MVDLIAYLDRNKPLSEPKWVRTGDVEDLLYSVFYKNVQGRAAWANKVVVVDPDPVRLLPRHCRHAFSRQHAHAIIECRSLQQSIPCWSHGQRVLM
jgi:hypothetical protein